MISSKLSPAEKFKVAAKATTTNVMEKARPGGRRNSESGTEVMYNEMREGDAKVASTVTYGVKRKEAVWTPQGTTKAITPKSDTFCPQDAKRWEKLPRDMSVQLRQTMLYSDRQEPRDVFGRMSTDENEVTVGEGDVDEMKVCQYEDCSKRATFGVNGIERYCKLHALFGMQWINVPT